jgi:hypothetical protein
VLLFNIILDQLECRRPFSIYEKVYDDLKYNSIRQNSFKVQLKEFFLPDSTVARNQISRLRAVPTGTPICTPGLTNADTSTRISRHAPGTQDLITKTALEACFSTAAAAAALVLVPGLPAIRYILPVVLVPTTKKSTNATTIIIAMIQKTISHTMTVIIPKTVQYKMFRFKWYKPRRPSKPSEPE